MLDIHGAQKAIREERLDGWLFLTFHHRDEIADAALGIGREKMNSRPWAFLIPADGEPVRIVHEIEASILDHLPGRLFRYYARTDFLGALARALPRGWKVAAQFSPDIPVGSFLDHGTALLVESLGVTLVSSANLVAKSMGALDAAGARAHEAAVPVLYDAIARAWDRLSRRLGAGREAGAGELCEAEVQGWIAESLSAAGLVADGPPLVASGAHSADPHYSIAGMGSAIRRGDVVQFDVWAKEDSEDAVYADISWIGVAGREPSPEQEAAFEAVVAAREAAIGLIEGALAGGRAVCGAEVDEAARAVLQARGFAAAIRHRTGHSIGRRVHGYGVNLDCIEFPDRRPLAEGACFSVEPGVYLDNFGMRTEVDCLIRGARLLVTGRERQRSLLTLA